MKKAVRKIVQATLLSLAVPGVLAAPVNYEMNLRTYSGMGALGGAGFMSMMLGGKNGATKQLELRLTNPADIPGGYSAEHTLPDGMHVGPLLPLRGERSHLSEGGSRSGGKEQPDGKVLLYWGCSATVAKGQPEVIDLKALGSRVPPEVAAMAQQGRKEKAGADGGEGLAGRALWWPNEGATATGIPNDASAVGEHVVKASFMQQDIRFTLDKSLDFLEAMNLKADSTDLKAAIPLQWASSSRAKGYNVSAFGSTKDKEVVIWMAAKNKAPMLPGSQTSCTIPASIFQKTAGAMAMGEIVGPVKSFVYPPQKPGEKKPPIWTAKVRLTGLDSVMLGMGDAVKDAAGESAADSVVPGGGGLMNAVKGLFGK